MKNINYKMMRKAMVALLMLLILSLSAQNIQNPQVVKFMGIPIDGTKSEMITQLKKKGFTYDRENDWLEGRFNGESVRIFVHTNNEVVDRIMVSYANTVNESNIKVEYNELVYQFENNEKYYSSEEDQYISDDVDISYEMSIKSKRFQASFHQCYTKIEMEEIRQSIYDNYEAFMETASDEIESIKEYGLFSDDDKETNVNTLVTMMALDYSMNNVVWFMIFESRDRYNQYYINIFYDNLRNRPNGEDL